MFVHKQIGENQFNKKPIKEEGLPFDQSKPFFFFDPHQSKPFHSQIKHQRN